MLILSYQHGSLYRSNDGGLDWHACRLAMDLLGSIHLYAVHLEDSRPRPLRKKAERLRKETGDEELEKLPFFKTIKIALIQPFITKPIVILLCIC